jgi:hypothetical protein
MTKKKKNLVHHTPAKVETFNPDYSQTKRDLTRIGILAGTFILILVILSFFQDQLVALFIK